MFCSVIQASRGSVSRKIPEQKIKNPWFLDVRSSAKLRTFPPDTKSPETEEDS